MNIIKHAPQGCHAGLLLACIQLKDVKSSSRTSKALKDVKSSQKHLKDVKSNSRMSKALKDAKSSFLMLQMGADKVYYGHGKES